MPPISLPPVGLGTFALSGDQCRQTVRRAIDLGYRHIDTAQMYANEKEVGEGIARSNVPRDELLIATKIHPANLEYADVIESGEASIDTLGVDVVDILYIHWPTDAYDPESTLQAFDTLYDRGRIRSMGVSNFSTAQLDEVIGHVDVPIAANQVEFHPLLQQRPLRREVLDRDLYLIAYSPILKGRANEYQPLASIGQKHGVSPSQVCLAWATGLENVVTIPKSGSETHLRENLDAVNIDLDREDFERIEAIDRETRLVSRAGAPWRH